MLKNLLFHQGRRFIGVKSSLFCKEMLTKNKKKRSLRIRKGRCVISSGVQDEMNPTFHSCHVEGCVVVSMKSTVNNINQQKQYRVSATTMNQLFVNQFPSCNSFRAINSYFYLQLSIIIQTYITKFFFFQIRNGAFYRRLLYWLLGNTQKSYAEKKSKRSGIDVIIVCSKAMIMRIWIIPDETWSKPDATR